MASAALRASRMDGRFIDLAGLRALGDSATVAELKAQGIDRVMDPDGNDLPDHTAVRTRNWVRPSYANGDVVLRVICYNSEGDNYYEVDLSERNRPLE